MGVFPSPSVLILASICSKVLREYTEYKAEALEFVCEVCEEDLDAIYELFDMFT